MLSKITSPEKSKTALLGELELPDNTRACDHVGAQNLLPTLHCTMYCMHLHALMCTLLMELSLTSILLKSHLCLLSRFWKDLDFARTTYLWKKPNDSTFFVPVSSSRPTSLQKSRYRKKFFGSVAASPSGCRDPERCRCFHAVPVHVLLFLLECKVIFAACHPCPPMLTPNQTWTNGTISFLQDFQPQIALDIERPKAIWILQYSSLSFFTQKSREEAVCPWDSSSAR